MRKIGTILIALSVVFFFILLVQFGNAARPNYCPFTDKNGHVYCTGLEEPGEDTVRAIKVAAESAALSLPVLVVGVVLLRRGRVKNEPESLPDSSGTPE